MPGAVNHSCGTMLSLGYVRAPAKNVPTSQTIYLTFLLAGGRVSYLLSQYEDNFGYCGTVIDYPSGAYGGYGIGRCRAMQYIES